MGGDALLDGLTEVLPEVEAVGNLLSSRGSGGGALGVGPGTVTAHDLDDRTRPSLTVTAPRDRCQSPKEDALANRQGAASEVTQ
jgi:hypothetical protein